MHLSVNDVRKYESDAGKVEAVRIIDVSFFFSDRNVRDGFFPISPCVERSFPSKYTLAHSLAV